MYKCNIIRKRNERLRFRLQGFLLILALVSLLVPLLLAPIWGAMTVFASNITGALYSGTVRISNNSTAATNVAVNFTLSTQSLIDDDFILSSCNNTAMRTNVSADTAHMPAPGSTTAWVVHVPTIGENVMLDYKLYTGGNNMDSKLRYFPESGGMTTTDSATLELGNNFTVEQKGWVDTAEGDNKNLVYKQNAFKTYVSAAGEITSVISIIYWSPTGFIDSASEWTNETNAYDEDTGTYARDSIGAINTWGNFLELTHSTITCDSIRFWVGLGTAQIDADVYYSEAWHDVYQGACNQGEWVVKSIPEGVQSVTSARVKLKSDGTYDYANLHEFDFSDEASVTATGIASGEHEVKTTADGSNLKIYVDDVEKDSEPIIGVSVPDNSNGWSFLSNSSMLYMEYHKITISGTLQQHIIWENNESTFSDQSGNGHSVTPTFRTTSTDSDVSAELITFEPVEQTKIDSYTLSQAGTMVPGAPGTIPEMYTELDTVHLPGARFVNDALDAGEIPRAMFWFPMCFGLAILVGFIVYDKSNSLLVQTIVSAFIMAFFSLTGVIPFWTILIFAIEAVGVIVATKQFGW